MDVYLGGKRVRLDPRRSIGKGGEADVFDLGDGRALKVWKTPEHPDYADQDAEQLAARERIEAHQRKLRVFPSGLPAQAITPDELATDKAGTRIVGYAMRLVRGAEVLMRYGEPSLRQGGLSAAEVSAVLSRLHRTVEAVHRSGVVIGDFNDLNVLVLGGEAHLIDADSFQFGGFLCRVYTERFVDPLLCDPALSRPVLASPYSDDSDWYAFAVMVMQSLLCVGPHGGIYRPRSKTARMRGDVRQSARPLLRVTVFHPEVQYPKPAIPWRVLPDDLLHALHLIFERDRRGVFPRPLLDALVWTRCTACGAEHARASCPLCAAAVAAVVPRTTVVQGEVVATRVALVRGALLAVALDHGDHGELRYLVHDGDRFVREDGSVVTTGAVDPSMRFALHAEATLIARGGELIVLSPGRAPRRIAVDCVGTTPVFDTNGRYRYWAHGGRLYRSGAPVTAPGRGAALFAEESAVPIGDVLEGQTRFWVGARFGLGFYRAGNLSIAFVFDAERPGIKDSVKLPFPGGQLTSATCVFGAGGPGEARAWLLLAAERGGRTLHRCVVVREDGAVLATADGEAGDGTWLGALTGKCAAFGSLLSATDAGLVRVELQRGTLVETRQFPSTEPYVAQTSRLLAGPNGLFVADARGIAVLRIA